MGFTYWYTNTIGIEFTARNHHLTKIDEICKSLLHLNSTLSSPHLHSSVPAGGGGARALFASSRYARHQFTICHHDLWPAASHLSDRFAFVYGHRLVHSYVLHVKLVEFSHGFLVLDTTGEIFCDKNLTSYGETSESCKYLRNLSKNTKLAG